MKPTPPIFRVQNPLANAYISLSSSIIRRMSSINFSSPSGRSEKSATDELKGTSLFGDSKTTYDEQYPPLTKSEGRKKISKVLRNQFGKVAEKPVTPSSSQLAANSISQQDIKSQPIGYEEKNCTHADRSTGQQDEKSKPVRHEEKNFNRADRSTDQQDQKSKPIRPEEKNCNRFDRSTGQQEEKSKPIQHEEKNFNRAHRSSGEQDEKSNPIRYEKNFIRADRITSQQDENYVPANKYPKGRGKRKNWIDLGTHSEKSYEKSITDGSLRSQQEPIGYENISNHANRSTSQQNENSVHNVNRNHKGTRGERSSDRDEKQHPVRPFDICTPNKSKIEGEIPLLERNRGIEYPITETRELLRAGMVLLTNYLSLSEQVDIINKCRELGLGPGGFYQPGYQDGAKLRLHMMCFGRRWDPVTKYEQHTRSDDQESIGIPGEFVLLVERALSDAHSLIKKNEIVHNVEEMLPRMSPDICIVNFYTAHGRLGLHQDRDESKASLHKGLPVVSFSVGDSAEFLYGDERDISKADSIILKSGDVLIFGGISRHVFHGITSVIPNSAPPALLRETKLRPGRLNLTFRQY